jgi:ribose 1,5-bisphosphokinase PhnN
VAGVGDGVAALAAGAGAFLLYKRRRVTQLDAAVRQGGTIELRQRLVQRGGRNGDQAADLEAEDGRRLA